MLAAMLVGITEVARLNRAAPGAPAEPGNRGGLLVALRDRQFRALTASYLTVTITMNLVLAAMPYFAEYELGHASLTTVHGVGGHAAQGVGRHSYGGIVVTNAATGNPNVKALVYVAAFAPDEGETLLGLQTRHPGSRLSEGALDLRPYGEGLVDGYIKKELIHDVFAGDLPKRTAELMWAGQRPADVRTLGEPSGAPGWKTVPSWYLVGRDDQVLPPAAQRFMAGRARAHTFEADTSHIAMIAQPAVTAALIRRAAR